jgi:hypothetical protein
MLNLNGLLSLNAVGYLIKSVIIPLRLSKTWDGINLWGFVWWMAIVWSTQILAMCVGVYITPLAYNDKATVDFLDSFFDKKYNMITHQILNNT